MKIRTGRSNREALPWACDLWLNLSASVLVSPAVSALLEGQDLSRIVVEISEQYDPAELNELCDAVSQLRARGAQIATDDLGSGRLIAIPVTGLDLRRTLRAVWAGSSTPPAGAARDLLSHILAHHGPGRTSQPQRS